MGIRSATPLLLFIVLGCSTHRESIPPPPAAPANDKIVIYQLMTRLFGNKQSANKPYGTLEENGVGKFNDITPPALAGIKELGVTHVWFTGVLEHPTLTDHTAHGISPDDPDVVKGRAGSPYTVKDYYDVDPDLAVNVASRMSEFERLVERTHAAGLKVIIDFVPNHVARRYHSDAKPDSIEDLGATDDTTRRFHPANNFYYLPGQSFQPPQDLYRRLRGVFPLMDGKFPERPAKVTGDDKFTHAPRADSWYEAVKLNYGVDYQEGRKTHFDPVPDTWFKMKDILVFWARRNVDGFRCDMAEMVPTAFWNWAIPQVRAVNPGIIFIAEIYNPSRYAEYIETGRFDYLYDKVQLYDTLRLLMRGAAKGSDVSKVRNSLASINTHLVHFLENHDEQRIASRFFAGSPAPGIPGMVVSATIDPGAVMIYFGQELGEAALGDEGFGGDDGRTSFYDYWGVVEHQKWMNGGAFDGGLLSAQQQSLRSKYANILRIAREETAIRTGDYADLTKQNATAGNISDRVVAFARFTESERLIVIAGFNPRAEAVKIQWTKEVADALQLPVAGSLEAGDLLGDTTRVRVSRGEGLSLSLPSFGARIFKLR